MACGDEGDKERQLVLSSSTRGRHLRHHEDSFRFCPVAVRQTLSAVTRQLFVKAAVGNQSHLGTMERGAVDT